MQAIIFGDANLSQWPLKADHYPIITIIDVSVEAGEPIGRPSLRLGTQVIKSQGSGQRCCWGRGEGLIEVLFEVSAEVHGI